MISLFCRVFASYHHVASLLLPTPVAFEPPIQYDRLPGSGRAREMAWRRCASSIDDCMARLMQSAGTSLLPLTASKHEEITSPGAYISPRRIDIVRRAGLRGFRAIAFA